MTALTLTFIQDVNITVMMEVMMGIDCIFTTVVTSIVPKNIEGHGQ